MKKVVSLLLAAVMVLCALPVATFGAFAAPDEGETAAVLPPRNPKWNGVKAVWDLPMDLTDDDDLDLIWYFSVELFKMKDETPVSLGTYNAFYLKTYDFSSLIVKNGPGKYYYTVKTSGGNSTYSDPVKSPTAEFTAENTPAVPLPAPSVKSWTTNYMGGQTANWTIRTEDISPDAHYLVHVVLYKNKEAVKELDLPDGTEYYDFYSSGDMPTDSDADYYVGVKLVPAEGEKRYTESKESLGTSYTVNPVKFLARSLDGTYPEVCRAGDTTLYFRTYWTGAYGTCKRVYLRLKITSTDESVIEKDTLYWNLSSVKGYNRFYLDESHIDNHVFREGDLVEWQLDLTTASDTTVYASVSGSFTVEAPVPHTVTFNAQGKGKNTTLTVPDRKSLYDVGNAKESYPDTPGYTIIGWSKTAKPQDEYVYDDLYFGVFYEDTTLYAILKPITNEAEVSVAPLVCGTKIRLVRDADVYWIRTPDVKSDPAVPKGASYRVASENSYWYIRTVPEDGAEADYKQFGGVVKGGETYYTPFYLEMNTDENGRYAKAFAPKEQMKLTGDFTSAEITYSNSGIGYSEIDCVIGVTAVHDWDEGKVTTPPTATATGVKTYTCAGCGAEKTEVLDKTAPAFLKGDVDADGNIKSGDARLALRAAVKLEKFWNQPASAEFLAADIDANEKITADDARHILRASVKLENPEKDW